MIALFDTTTGEVIGSADTMQDADGIALTMWETAGVRPAIDRINRVVVIRRDTGDDVLVADDYSTAAKWVADDRDFYAIVKG